jgi:hypothetical protein
MFENALPLARKEPYLHIESSANTDMFGYAIPIMILVSFVDENIYIGKTGILLNVHRVFHAGF